MAISWSRQTVFDAGNSAAVNTVNVRNAIRTLLLGHASGAWTEVEQVVVGTYTHYVFKCAAAQSGLAADYYVVMTYNTAVNSLYFACAEGYDSATNTLSKFVPVVNTGNNRTDINADTTVVQTYVLTNAIPAQTYLLPVFQVMAVTASIDLWMQLSEKHFYVGFGTTTTIGVGAWLDTLLGADDPMPIGIAAPSIHNNAGAVPMSRHPLAPTPAPGTFYTHSVMGVGYALSQHMIFPYWMEKFSFVQWDKYWAAGPMMAEVIAMNAVFQYVNPGACNTLGGVRGKWRGLRVSISPAGGAYADTITSDGTTWFCIAVTTTGGLTWAVWLDTGAA